MLVDELKNYEVIKIERKDNVEKIYYKTNKGEIIIRKNDFNIKKESNLKDGL